MLIVVSEPCGCLPFQKHNHPNCKLYQQRKKLEVDIKRILEKFKWGLKIK